MAKRSLTIKKEMFLLNFSFFSLVSLLFSGIFLYSFYTSSIANAQDALRNCNKQIVAVTEGMFHENATIVELLARDETVINGSTETTSEVLTIFDKIYQSNENITYVYSGYTNGSLFINNYTEPSNFNVTNRPWYRAAVATDGVARLVYSDAATGVWLFSQCVKMVDEKGNTVGVVAVDCSNESITRQLGTKYQYASQRSFIVNLQGTVLLHPEERHINSDLKKRMHEKTWNGIVNGYGNYAEYGVDNTTAMAYFERIPQTEFLVVTSIDAAEVMNPITLSIFGLFLLIVAISIGLALLLCHIMIDRFARPVIELRKRIQHLAVGKSDQSREIRASNAEINDIAESIEIIVKDIANSEEQRKAAEYLSFHDSMTGLYNRRFLDEEMARMDTSSRYPLCLICCDVNGLKLVNDVFGHAVGDKLISAIAQCLLKNCRMEDVLARVGGDEFVLALPNTGPDEAERIIRRIMQGYPAGNVCGAHISAALGYAVKTERGTLLADVLREADEMMYQRKLTESTRMKQQTVSNIIAAAQREGLVKPFSEHEEALLKKFADAFCPDMYSTLADSYRYRKIGLCTLILLPNGNVAEDYYFRHTENGFRILSALDQFRSVASYVLNYTEHWDGSGYCAGLSGTDIPLLSRIIAVIEVACTEGGAEILLEKSGVWYDPELVDFLLVK